MKSTQLAQMGQITSLCALGFRSFSLGKAEPPDSNSLSIDLYWDSAVTRKHMLPSASKLRLRESLYRQWFSTPPSQHTKLIKMQDEVRKTQNYPIQNRNTSSDGLFPLREPTLRRLTSPPGNKFVFVFVFFAAEPAACGSSQGQGLNPHHSSYRSHCSDNAGSLTHWAIRIFTESCEIL